MMMKENAEKSMALQMLRNMLISEIEKDDCSYLGDINSKRDPFGKRGSICLKDFNRIFGLKEKDVPKHKNLQIIIEIEKGKGKYEKSILTMEEIENYRAKVCDDKERKIIFSAVSQELTEKNIKERKQYEQFKETMFKALASKGLELDLDERQTEIFLSSINQSNSVAYYNALASMFISMVAKKTPILGQTLPKFTIRQKANKTLEISVEFYFVGYDAESGKAMKKIEQIEGEASSYLDKCERFANDAISTAKATLSLNKAATDVKFTYSIESRDPNLRIEPTIIEGDKKGVIDNKQEGLIGGMSTRMYSVFTNVTNKMPTVKMPTAKGAFNALNNVTSSVTSATSSVTSAVTSLWKNKKSNESKKKNESGSAVNNDGNTDLKSAVEKAGIDPKSLDKLTQDELTAFEASYKLFLEQQNQKDKNSDNKNNNDDSKPRND